MSWAKMTLGSTPVAIIAAKVAVNRLAFSQGHELGGHGATAVAVTPGWLRSEMMLDDFGVTEDNWRDSLDGAVAGYPGALGLHRRRQVRSFGASAVCCDEPAPSSPSEQPGPLLTLRAEERR